jgi:Leucine-rich repeat (LRR) protein
MTSQAAIQRITASELRGVTEDLRRVGGTDLVLLGADYRLPHLQEHWPEILRGRRVFVLAELIPDIDKHVVQVATLQRLLLWGQQMGSREAKAIADTLTGLTCLDLSFNEIGDVGARAIAAMKQLTSLNLSANQIGQAGARAIAAMKQLTSLNLSFNQIGQAGATAIAADLRQLTSLNLSSNPIGDAGATAIAAGLKQLTSLNLLASSIRNAGATAIAAGLTQLTSLNLSANPIGDAGATAIAAGLKQLTALELHSNQIGDAGATAIAAGLKQLTSLELSFNQIADVGATAIAAGLKQLTSLNLSSNQIADAGATAIAAGLKQLTSLYLYSNQIADAGVSAIGAGLKQLTSLNLSSNQIGEAGAEAIAYNITSLEVLNLAYNDHITSASAFASLTMIRFLDLSETGITDLVPLRTLIELGLTVSLDPHDAGLVVHKCPLVRPTVEVVQQGHAAVLNYFQELDRQGVDYLYEAKVLVVGKGGAGKTSLIRRLYYPSSPLPGEDESTHGIEIHVQHFRRADGTPFRLNVWDFGGQQIYHATHQFFLTKNSLYILVDDTKEDHKSVRDEGFKHWLEVVEVFGGHSPLLIFQNEKGGRSKKIDEAGIKGRFSNVLNTFAGNLAVAGSTERLRRAIELYVQELPHVGEAVPAKWVAIHSEIEELAEKRPYLSHEEYFALYAKHLEPNREKALFLSRYLHDLGVFLHFQDDLRLRKTVVIQNRWATEGVFRILDDEEVKRRSGHFTLKDCARLWADSAYADMHPELLTLMEKFELCYKFADSQDETWLAPQLLNPSTPAYVQDWNTPEDLVLSYRYEFLPRGLVSRLMVRMHRFVANPELCWANGALFEYEQSVLLARSENSGDAISLRARGKESKALLSVIATALDALNDSFQGLRGKVGKWVPCTCGQCRRSTNPELFEQQHLLQRKRDNRLEIECRKSYEMVPVLELLDGLRLEQLPSWAKDRQTEVLLSEPAKADPNVRPAASREIRIFLASSKELSADRDEFDLYFRQQNDGLRARGIYLKIVRWENFLNAMSETRLQDEYNNEIQRADIFVRPIYDQDRQVHGRRIRRSLRRVQEIRAATDLRVLQGSARSDKCGRSGKPHYPGSVSGKARKLRTLLYTI